MASLASLRTRVRKLEKGRTPRLSPFERWYGSLEAFEQEVQAGIDAGTLDGRDMPIVMKCVRRWHKEEVWGLWQRYGVWEMGGDRP